MVEASSVPPEKEAMPSLRSAAALAVAMLTVAVAPAAAKVGGPDALTTGTH